MLFIRSLVFYVGYILSGVIAGFIACILGPFLNLNMRLKTFSLWPRFTNWFLEITCQIKVEIEGKEYIPKDPCIVVSNHQGQWETFSFQYLFHPLCTLLKKELLYIPLWGWGLSLLKPIAIDRNKPKQALMLALSQGEERINSGMFVLFFPEGTRVKPKNVQKYARSSFELAARTKTKVLPLVHNSGDCWPAHKFLKYPGIIKLRIGAPFFVDNAKEKAVEIEEWTRENLNEITD